VEIKIVKNMTCETIKAVI